MVAAEREAGRKRSLRGRALRPAAAHGGRHCTAGRMQSGLGRQGSARAVFRGVSVLPRWKRKNALTPLRRMRSRGAAAVIVPAGGISEIVPPADIKLNDC